MVKKRSKKAKEEQDRYAGLPQTPAYINNEERYKGSIYASLMVDKKTKAERELKLKLDPLVEKGKSIQREIAERERLISASANPSRLAVRELEEQKIKLDEIKASINAVGSQLKVLEETALRPPRVFQTQQGLVAMDESGSTIPLEGTNIIRTQQEVIAATPQRRVRIIKPDHPSRAYESIGSLFGEGKESGEALWDHQINQIMSKRSKTYLGTIAADEIAGLDIPEDRRSSFIVNTSTRDEKGKHWIAIFIDPVKDRSVEIFDSLGEEPSSKSRFGKRLIRDLQEKIGEMQLPYMLRWKVNDIINQDSGTDTCGYFAIRFILDREDGVPWKEATGWKWINRDVTSKGERRINKFKKSIKKIMGFGWV